MILTLTKSGKRKAKDIATTGPEASVLASLEENGPSELKDIAQDVNTTERNVKQTAAKLANRGFVTRDEE